MSSHTGENARRPLRPASRGSAPRRALERAPRPEPMRWKASRSRNELPGIDVPRSEPGSGDRERARLSGSGPDAEKGRQRDPIDRASGEPKKRRSPFREDARAPNSEVERTEAGGRAVKRAAAGGWMTARWSGAGTWKDGGNTLLAGAGLEVERWRVYPRRPAGSLQRWCQYRVLVT